MALGKKGNEEAGTPALVDNLTMSGGLCQEDAGSPLPSWGRGAKGFEKTKSQKDHLKKTKRKKWSNIKSIGCNNWAGQV